MIIFQMESPTHNCDYQFKYDSNGRIIGFEILGENKFSSQQTRDLFAKVFETVGDLKQFAQRNKIALIEIREDLSFEAFWKQYDNSGGSKKNAEAKWSKLSEKNKSLAIGYIKKYKQSLGTTTQAYATTYLNGQYWIK